MDVQGRARMGRPRRSAAARLRSRPAIVGAGKLPCGLRLFAQTRRTDGSGSAAQLVRAHPRSTWLLSCRRSNVLAAFLTASAPVPPVLLPSSELRRGNVTDTIHDGLDPATRALLQQSERLLLRSRAL